MAPASGREAAPGVSGECSTRMLAFEWDQCCPVLQGLRIPGERLPEPPGHGMLRAVSIARVEIDLHAHAITQCRTGCFSNITVEVQIDVSVPCRHHVNAPSLCRFAIDAHQNRKRLAPARLDAFAREALTRMKGLTPLISVTAVKLEVVMELSDFEPSMQSPARTLYELKDLRRTLSSGR
jgi:hypothetical protein